jgi:hypothetical protein
VSRLFFVFFSCFLFCPITPIFADFPDHFLGVDAFGPYWEWVSPYGSKNVRADFNCHSVQTASLVDLDDLYLWFNHYLLSFSHP